MIDAITSMIEAKLDSLVQNPVHRNVLCAIATVVYVKVVIGVCEWAVASPKIRLAPKISRKCIHIAAGSWIVFWPFFAKEHWTWRLNVLVPVIYTVQLFVKGSGILQVDPNTDVDVKTMTRTGSPAELLNGPIFLTLLMTIVGLKCFRTQLGVVIMTCLGYGDGIAPLVGYYFPCGTQYPTYPFGPNDKKTVTGSLGFFLASIVGYYALKFVIVENDNDNVGESSNMEFVEDEMGMIVIGRYLPFFPT